MKRAAGLHPVRQARSAESAALRLMGRSWHERRAREIAALPTVEWKGTTLWTIRCCGVSGRGPHDQHVPLALLWALVSLTNWHCPFHAKDVWADRGTS
jgi:hypothetical protein